MKHSIPALCASVILPLMMACGDSQDASKPYNLGINIIPAPREIMQEKGNFKLDASAAIGAATPESKQVAEYFAQKLRRATGYDMPLNENGNIMLVLEAETSLCDEGYRLSVSPNRVVVTATTPQGLFYGMQSFMQLLPAEIESPALVQGVDWKAPALSITDAPRFGYRGVHLDPSRHFITVEEVKKQIDVLALFKINKIHWHLTDDQGWRIEIKKYPKLTEVGGKRVEGDGTVYGSFFYTQDQVREIVAYAADRFITIIPELEIPGHELAAIAAYPELSCKGLPTTPRIIWGVEDIVMCPGKESVFSFLEDVIDEMVELFPGTYFHIGGDECPKVSWEKCPLCQKRIREEGLKADPKHSPEELLQSYVVNRIEKYLAGYGKKIIGWDEILEGQPQATATIMSWRGEAGGIAAAMAGHDAIMTPGPNGLYLDYYQGDSKIEPVAIGGYSPLEKVYGYEPVPDTLVTIGKGQHIIGVQVNNWSEYLYSNDILEYHMYPRTLALAEIAWAVPSRKDYSDFERRINNAYVRLDGHAINYHIPLPEQPGGSCNHVAFVDSVSLVFTTSRPMALVYTTDGLEPNAQSAIYDKPLFFDQSGTLKIASLLPSGKMSKVRTIQVEKQLLAPAKEVVKLTPGLEMAVTYGMFLDMQQFAIAAKEPDATMVIKETKALTSFVPSSTSMRGVKQYAAVANGYVDIPEDGVYFISSNLEEVWIDGQLLVNNRGEVKRHSRNDTSIALAKGIHQLKAVFLGHIIGGWPSNWNDGSINLRKSDEPQFKTLSADRLWH